MIYLCSSGCSTVTPPAEWRDINGVERERFIFHKVHVDTSYDPFTKRPYHQSVLAVKVLPQTLSKEKTKEKEQMLSHKNFSKSSSFSGQQSFNYVSLKQRPSSIQNQSRYDRILDLDSIFLDRKTHPYHESDYVNFHGKENPLRENQNKHAYYIFSKPREETTDYHITNHKNEKHTKRKNKAEYKHTKRVSSHRRHLGKKKSKKAKRKMGNFEIRGKNQKPSKYLKRISQLDNFSVSINTYLRNNNSIKVYIKIYCYFTKFLKWI